MKLGIFAYCAAGLLAGCATPPERIKPMRTNEFCTSEMQQRLYELSRIQNRTASNDAVGVFFIGLPVGSMGGGNHEYEIARLKGACENPNRQRREPSATSRGISAPPSGPVYGAM